MGSRDMVGLCCVSIVSVSIGCFVSLTSDRDRCFFWKRYRSAVYRLRFDFSCVLTKSIVASDEDGMAIDRISAITDNRKRSEYSAIMSRYPDEARLIHIRISWLEHTIQSSLVSHIDSLPHYYRRLRSIASNRFLVASGMCASRTRALLPITQLDALGLFPSLRFNASGLRSDA